MTNTQGSSNVTSLEVYGRTDSGGKERSEDTVLINADIGLFLVADGVGGNPAGDVASRMAADTTAAAMTRLEEAFKRTPPAPGEGLRRRVEEAVQSAVDKASERLFERGNSRPELKTMATSMLLFKQAGSSAVIGHVGNSRAYLIRRNRIYRLTDDHTLAWHLVDKGALKKEDVETFPYKNVITRAVGKYPTVSVDTLPLDLSPGDVYLLCSNGVTGVVDEEELFEIASAGDTKATVDEVMALVNRRRTKDDASLVVIRVSGDEATEQRWLMEQKIAFLRRNFLFRDLSFQEMARVLSVVHEVSYREGETIFAEGDTGDDFYIIVSGNISVAAGGKVLTEVGAGGHFGELALVLSPVRSATVTAKNRLRLLRFSRKDFEALVREEPVLANKLLVCMLQNVGTRVRELSRDYTNILKERERQNS